MLTGSQNCWTLRGFNKTDEAKADMGMCDWSSYTGGNEAALVSGPAPPAGQEKTGTSCTIGSLFVHQELRPKRDGENNPGGGTPRTQTSVLGFAAVKGHVQTSAASERYLTSPPGVNVLQHRGDKSVFKYHPVVLQS